MIKSRDHLDHLSVVACALIWIPKDQVPIRSNSTLCQHLEALKLLDSRAPFVHQLQDVVAETLNPWLNMVHPCITKNLCMLAAYVGFHLEEEREVQVILFSHPSQPRQ